VTLVITTKINQYAIKLIHPINSELIQRLAELMMEAKLLQWLYLLTLHGHTTVAVGCRLGAAGGR